MSAGIPYGLPPGFRAVPGIVTDQDRYPGLLQPSIFDPAAPASLMNVDERTGSASAPAGQAPAVATSEAPLQRPPFGFGPMGVPDVVPAAPVANSGIPSFGVGSNAPDLPAMPAPQASAARPMPASPSLRPMRSAPMPPPRPSDMPAPEAVPTAGTMPAPAAAPSASPIADGGFDFGGALKRFTDRGGSDLLVGLGTGLMSTPGFGNGLAAGFQNAQKAEQQRAVTGLAQAELGIKQRKLAQETAALSGNASVIKRAFPSLSDAEAASAGANSSLVTEAYKILRDPNHGKGIPPNYRQRADGQGYEPIPGSEADPATKESMSAAAARGAASVKPDEKFNLIPDAERAALGLPAGAYQRDSSGKISPINSTGTTINMGGEKAYDAEVGKSYAKQFTDFQTSGRNAGAKLNSLALMEQQMTKPDFYSGLGAENVKRLNQFLGVVGIKNPAAASPAEVVDALSNQVVMDQLGGSLGAGISDSDRKAIALIGPGIAKTPEGNRQLIGIYRSIAQREQEISQMARDYAKANGGRIDAGFDDRVAQFGLANPLFPAAQANATAQSDGKAGPVATPAAGTAPRGGTRRVFDPATGNFR